MSSVVFDRTYIQFTVGNSLFTMATSSTGTPRVLILGHSFVRRLRSDLQARFDERTAINVGLLGTAEIYMHGVGGRTVPKLRRYDLGVISKMDIEVFAIQRQPHFYQLGCILIVRVNILGTGVTAGQYCTH